MTDYEVERALGCTPCVCGDLETWHFACYAGKTAEQLEAGHKAAMRKARVFIKTRLAQQTAGAIRAAAIGNKLEKPDA